LYVKTEESRTGEFKQLDGRRCEEGEGEKNRQQKSGGKKQDLEASFGGI
jgi:hypothetical protein